MKFTKLNCEIPPLCASREGESLSKAKEGGEYMRTETGEGPKEAERGKA